MIILAIDPGTEKLGISLMSEECLINTWFVKIESDDITKRYRSVFLSIRRILEELSGQRIDYYSIETPFFSRNMATTIKLGMVRGIIMGCIYEHDFFAKIIDINPVEVRINYGLKKNADKKACHAFLKMAWGTVFRQDELKEDVLDSIGIGLAALSKIKTDESKKVRTKNIGRKRRTRRSVR